MAIYSGFSHKQWWLSIATLNYQRVICFLQLEWLAAVRDVSESIELMLNLQACGLSCWSHRRPSEPVPTCGKNHGVSYGFSPENAGHISPSIEKDSIQICPPDLQHWKNLIWNLPHAIEIVEDVWPFFYFRTSLTFIKFLALDFGGFFLRSQILGESTGSKKELHPS